MAGMLPIVKSPVMPIESLDTLWFQVSGTLCNLTCQHCFISCSPKNRSFGMLTLQQVEHYLQQGQQLGVREYYFTGGEPFLNRQLIAILLRTLDFGPATVLTNATVCKSEGLARLAAKVADSPYGLEFRVSLDGYDPQTNDAIRGQGVFEKTMKGVSLLVDHGFLPILTVTRTWEEADDRIALQKFQLALRQAGCLQARVKILPTLKMGAEAERTGGYRAEERVEGWMLDSVGRQHFVCGNSRLVSDRGVHVCPILLESAEGLLESGEAASLSKSLRPFPLEHGACFTCYQYGAICSNAPSQSMTESGRPS